MNDKVRRLYFEVEHSFDIDRINRRKIRATRQAAIAHNEQLALEVKIQAIRDKYNVIRSGCK